MERWYVLHTKLNMEHQVTTVLQNRGIQSYLPEISQPQAKDKTCPFFPGYLFIKIDFNTVSSSFVEWVPGLRRIVAFDNQPIPLPDEVIELIQHRLSELKAAGGYPGHNFKPGDTVRIIDGPFKEMVAIFDRSAPSSRRVQILLSVLGQASRVKVNVTDLAKFSPDQEASISRPPRRTRGRGRPIIVH